MKTKRSTGSRERAAAPGRAAPSGPRALPDLAVALICLSGAFLSLRSFWGDLNRTLVRQSETPIAAVTAKTGGAQRRFADRLLWSQLREGSPLYDGDLARTASLSDATITFVSGGRIMMDENCLARIFVHEGEARVELGSGSLNARAGSGPGAGDLVIAAGDQTIRVAPGSVVGVGGDGEGLDARVAAGSAVVTGGGETVTLGAGEAARVDAAGTRPARAVVVRSPLPDQVVLIAPSAGAARVPFEWTLANGVERGRVEIARDRRFSRVEVVREGGPEGVPVDLTEGTWWWRAYPADGDAAGASSMRLTVRGGAAPEPRQPLDGEVTPADGDGAGTVTFRWALEGGGDGVTYVLEAADNPYFRAPAAARAAADTSLRLRLPEGVWYWRVSARYSTGLSQEFAAPSRAIRFTVGEPAGEWAGALPDAAWPDASAAEAAAETAAAEAALAEAAVEAAMIEAARAEAVADAEAARAEAARAARAAEAARAEAARAKAALAEAARAAEARAKAAADAAAAPAAAAPPSRVVLEAPADGSLVPGLRAWRQPGSLRWSAAERPETTRVILARDPNPVRAADLGTALIDEANGGRVVALPRLGPGTYYWTLLAEGAGGADMSATGVRRFTVLPVDAPRVRLEEPAAGTVIDGLDLLRRPGAVGLRWSSEEDAGSARLLLARGGDPRKAAPGDVILDLRDPARTVALPRLDPGTYSWIVEAETPDGFDISAPAPAGFRVLPVPPLPAPALTAPAADARIGAEELLAGAAGRPAADRPAADRPAGIDFAWEATAGATGYLFELRLDGAAEPVVTAGPLTEPRFRLADLSGLENGIYWWRVEAVALGPDGSRERQGEAAAGRFVFDVPRPGAPALKPPGTLYGW